MRDNSGLLSESKGKDTLFLNISGELVAAGGSETESQHWIRSIRSRIWKPKNINRTGKILLVAL